MVEAYGALFDEGIGMKIRISMNLIRASEPEFELQL